MNNLQKAIELLNDISDFQSENIGIVHKSLELASEPNWYFPEKKELPKIGELVYCVLKVGKSKGIAAMETDGFWYAENFTKHTNQIEAWAYLPTYRI